MKPTKYTSLSADWNVNLERAEFSSPSKDEPNQMVLFPGRVKNGAISASITPLAGQLDPNWGHDFREGGFVFRYTDQDHFYAAGVGGFGMRFFLGKVSPSEWRLLEGAGLAASVKFKESYQLRVEFSSDRMTLIHNDVPVLSVIDNTYYSGFCGLRSNRTEVEFRDVDVEAIRPKCFVIMPFDSELDGVYRVIKETVEQHDIDCSRADARYISQPIIEDVKSQIAGADLVVVDFTNQNPNVYYEAGLADAWKKKWIVLAQSTNDLAFDVRHIRSITYSNKKMGDDHSLRERLQQALKETLGATRQVNE